MGAPRGVLVRRLPAPGDESGEALRRLQLLVREDDPREGPVGLLDPVAVTVAVRVTELA